VNKQWAMDSAHPPFGLGVDWKHPDTFTGRYIVTKAQLNTLNGTYDLAFQVNDKFSVAVGADAMFANVELNRNELQPVIGGGGGQVDVAKLHLESDYTPDVGWNAAFAWRPEEHLRVGAYYRSKVVVDVTGRAEFQQILTGDTTLDKNVAKNLPPNQDVRTVLRFPALGCLAVAYEFPRELTLEGDFTAAQWSVFEDLPLYFQSTPSTSTKIEEDYNDAIGVRLGVEQRLPSVTWRAGWYYEDEAAPQESLSPILPDAIRNGYSVGLGKAFGPNQSYSIDLYELAVVTHGRGTGGVNRDGYDGTYKTFINIFGLGLTRRW
jgi:long-chain fatty acid transport protein